jgi:DNA-binding beta-propeller fold protein YncE
MSNAAVSSQAGRASVGSHDGVGTNARFNYPIGLALSSVSTFAVVADYGNCIIRKIVLSTGSVTTAAGSTSSITGSADGVGTLARFSWPYSVVLTSDDSTAYVLDRYNNSPQSCVCYRLNR